MKRYHQAGTTFRVAALVLTVIVLSACSSSKIIALGDIDNIDIVKEHTVRKGDFLVARMELANTSKTAQELAYRVRWLNKDKEQVWADEPWKPVLLHGKQTIHIESVAPTKLATDFTVEMHAVNN